MAICQDDLTFVAYQNSHNTGILSNLPYFILFQDGMVLIANIRRHDNFRPLSKLQRLYQKRDKIRRNIA